MSSLPPIVRIEAGADMPPSLDQPRVERRVAGAPWRKTWLLHESGPMSAGIWECEVGRWRIEFPSTEQEYFFVLSGRARLHGPAGALTDIGPGQAVVIPPGFIGEFEVLEPVRKHFVVLELPAA